MNNNHMIMFDPRPGHPNSIASRKRPNGGGDGLLVFRDGKLVLAIGSPAGGRKATAIAQIVCNVFVFGMGIQEAVAAERIHSEDQPQTLILEPTFTPDLSLALAARGYKIEIDSYTARVAAVQRDPVTGELSPGCDPRCNAGFSAASLN
jgi:gamma-glutamyltranspeptidase/glutathione hydrolase